MRPRATPLVLLIIGIIFALLPASAGGQTSVESELLGLINGGRNSRVELHGGLRTVARVHSQEMARDGGLNHNGAEGRIMNAPPDPSESNGPPDDGFTGTWCENVAYVRGAPESEVARRVYEGWTNSSTHNRCMNDERMTAAGVGLYFDGDRTYWATYESAVDQTLPGSTPATPAPTPTRTAGAIVPTLRTEPPERTEPPPPTMQPTSSPTASASPSPQAGTSPTPAIDVAGAAGRTGGPTQRLLTAPTVPSSTHAAFGWGELTATMGVIALAAEFLRRLSRRRDRSETT